MGLWWQPATVPGLLVPLCCAVVRERWLCGTHLYLQFLFSIFLPLAAFVVEASDSPTFFHVPLLAKGKAWILRARCGRSSQSFCLSVHKNVQRDWSQTLLLCLRTVTTNNSQALVRALPYTRKSNQNNPTTDGAQVLTPTSQAAEHGTPTPPTRDGDCYYDDNYVVLIFVTQSVTARPSPWGSSTGSTAGAP